MGKSNRDVLTKTIHELFEENMNSYSDNVAVKDCRESLTYRELDKKSNEVANHLIECGIEVNDYVGIILDPSISMITVILGILKCGGIYVPIDPGYPKKRIEYMIENTGLKTIIMDYNYDVQFENVIMYDQIANNGVDSRVNCNSKKSTDLAYVIYTSGSSGKPKGVMIEHRSVVNLVKEINNLFQMSSEDNALLVTSMCFDLSVYDIFGMFDVGGTIVIASKEDVKDPRILKDLIEEESISFWNSVPTSMTSLMKVLKEDIDNEIISVKNIFLSGDWIPINLIPDIKKYFPEAAITSLGGATEGTVWSIYYPIEFIRDEWKSIPYGKPIQGNYFYILDENLNEVEVGTRGELYIGGIGVAKGYINDSERTERAFIRDVFSEQASGNMYRTGDFGLMCTDGNIEFLGRIDEQVKIRGFRVELKEIEKQLLEHCLVHEAIVLALQNSQKENYLVAYITIKMSINMMELKRKLREVLPEYMIPSVIIEVGELPLNHNGKVDKKKLPKPSLSLIAIDVEFVEASTEIEKVILEAWVSVLGHNEISIMHDFFEIGGTSIDCITLESKLRDVGIHLRYADIKEYSTILNQAHFINSDNDNSMNNIDYQKSITNEKELKPFNDIFYKSCLYSSLFPIVSYYKRNINSFLVNDIFQYKMESHNDKYYISSDCIEDEKFENIIKNLSINTEYEKYYNSDDLMWKLDYLMDKNGFAIIWVDSFYESQRRDTFNKEHLAHTLLVVGKPNNNEYKIIEHSNKNARNYTEIIISKSELIHCYMGYIENLLTVEEKYTFIGVNGCNENYVYNDFFDKSKFKKMCSKNQNLLISGLKELEKFTEFYCKIELHVMLRTDTYLAALVTGINKILDYKRSELYRMNRMFIHEKKITNGLDEIISCWEQIRNDLVRYIKGIAAHNEVIKIHTELLKIVLEIERDIIFKFNSKLN